MATLTKITKFRRKLRRKNMGKDRKAQMRIHGSTPKFPVHTEEADANAPNQVSPKK
jgi:hypothetical protein